MCDWGSLQNQNGLANQWSSLSGLFGPSGSSLSSYYQSHYQDWTTVVPTDEGWYLYENTLPPKNVLLKFLQLSSDYRSWVGYDDFPPTFNISGLRWKLTGIGKHQIETEVPRRYTGWKKVPSLESE